VARQRGQLENHFGTVLDEAGRQYRILERSELWIIIYVSLRHERIVLVKDVKRLQPDLKVQPLAEFLILEYRHIGSEVTWTGEAIPAGVSPADGIPGQIFHAGGSQVEFADQSNIRQTGISESGRV
jgi:hypothetical protein